MLAAAYVNAVFLCVPKTRALTRLGTTQGREIFTNLNHMRLKIPAKTGPGTDPAKARGSTPDWRTFCVLVYAALLLAVAYFIWRGVWRGIVDSGDLMVGYSAGQAWVLGRDPYDSAVLKNAMIVAGGGDRLAMLDRLLNPYFPSTLPAFAALAALSWPVTKLLFLAVNTAGAMFIALGLGRLVGWRHSDPRALALAAFVLAFAPVHTTISSGQTGVISTAALLGAVLLERASHRIWSGIFYGLATILKIQIGLPFVAYLFWRQRWVAGMTAGLLTAASSLLAILRLQAAGVPWASSWFSNVAAMSGPGGINDSSPLNPERYP